MISVMSIFAVLSASPKNVSYRLDIVDRSVIFHLR